MDFPLSEERRSYEYEGMEENVRLSMDVEFCKFQQSV